MYALPPLKRQGILSAMHAPCFGKHIGSMVYAYVDDIVVKSMKVENLIEGLEIAFGCLQANNIKLNPRKFVFGLPRGMLSGYIVS